VLGPKHFQLLQYFGSLVRLSNVCFVDFPDWCIIFPIEVVSGLPDASAHLGLRCF
jgi:hypothetical protein